MMYQKFPVILAINKKTRAFSLAEGRARFPRTLASGETGVNREAVIMPGVKHLSSVLKMAPIELTKAYVPVKNILVKLGISQSTLTRITQLRTLRMADPST